MRLSSPKTAWPLVLTALSAATAALALVLSREISVREIQAQREESVQAWAAGFARALSLRDDFLMDAMGSALMASGASLCEVYDPSGKILFPPEASPGLRSEAAILSAESGRSLLVLETLGGLRSEVRYLPMKGSLGSSGVLRAAWPAPSGTGAGPWSVPWAAAFAGSLLVLAAAAFREKQIAPVLLSTRTDQPGDESQTLDGSPFKLNPSGHVLISENRVLASWGELQALLGSSPNPGEHISKWKALSDASRLRAVLESLPWPEPGLDFRRQESGKAVLLSFFHS